jgi:NADH:ubiquinone oxidoreductase subunit H
VLGLPFLVLLERIILGLSQQRCGPKVVGIFALMQTLVDRGKLFLKSSADKLAVGLTFFCFSYGCACVRSDSEMGWLLVLYFLGVIRMSVFRVALNNGNTYASIAALRVILMLMSFDVAFRFLCISVVFLVKRDLGGVLLIFFLIALIELRRTPSDLSEAESELVARHGLDYDRFCFTVLFLREYIRFYWIFRVMGFMLNFRFRVVLFIHFMLIAIRAVLGRFKFNQLLRTSWGPVNLGVFLFFVQR